VGAILFGRGTTIARVITTRGNDSPGVGLHHSGTNRSTGAFPVQKFLVATVLATLALVPAACNTSPPGGATGTGTNTGSDNEFKIVGGTIPNSIKQGDTESIKVSLVRGKNFHQTVKLSAKAPDKITADIDRTTVKDGESADVNVKVHPAADVAPGDYKIMVTGTPDTGSATTLELTVKVAQK